MNTKICFVIMGYGKKTDFTTGYTFDLDQTYKNIIKPAVTKCGLQCIRGDEILESGNIDKNMYLLLMCADLVIADISTYNPNAIYELGVRHAVKPFSTIIIKEKSLGKIPFDLDHTKMFTYAHLGEDIGVDESKRCIEQLSNLINHISLNNNIDSPLYEYITKVTPPKIPANHIKELIKKLIKKDSDTTVHINLAKKYMSLNDFNNAFNYWEKAIEFRPNEIYFQQQLALCKYKSKSPSELSALMDANIIIEKLLPSNDPETLGIAGAICKNTYMISKDPIYLNRAIEYYSKGYKLNDNYYTGENYALCLDMKRVLEKNKDEITYLKCEATKTRIKIISKLQSQLTDEDFENRLDKKWIYATLAHCYLSINKVKSKSYENKFNDLALEWEIETYNKNKTILKNLLTKSTKPKPKTKK